MTELNQYCEVFWGEEFTSAAGYEVLCRHNTDQRKFLKHFEEYLKNRSRLEQEYSKGLSQLSKSLRERTTVGELDKAWNYLVAEVDSSLQAHDTASSSLTQQADKVKRLCRELTLRRDTVEERVKQFHGQKVSQFKTVQTLMKVYGQKCREFDQQRDAYQVLDRGVTCTPRDREKAKSKMDKSDDEANKADIAYKNAIQLLEERRRDWEREMDQACKEFQERDEEQIQFLREQMWFTTNALSQVALDVDEGCERVRKVLEGCEIHEEIHRFLAHNATGTQRPAPILYQNYHYDNNASTNHGNDDGHHRPPASSAQRSSSSSSSSPSSPSSSSSSLLTPALGKRAHFSGQGRKSSDLADEDNDDVVSSAGRRPSAP